MDMGLAGSAGCGWRRLSAIPVKPDSHAVFAAALLAYLGDPLADQLEKKMSRTLAVSIVFLVILLVLTVFVLLVFPMLTQQLAYLIGKMPGYLDGLQKNVVPLLSEKLGVEGELIDLQLIKKLFTAHYQQAGGLFRNWRNQWRHQVWR